MMRSTAFAAMFALGYFIGEFFTRPVRAPRTITVRPPGYTVH
jgi:hypothetical protein